MAEMQSFCARSEKLTVARKWSGHGRTRWICGASPAREISCCSGTKI